MSLIAGSYERFIWGFKLKPQTHDPSSQCLTLTQIFSYPSHIAPITTVAAAGPAAASGSSDDTVHIYDLSSAASLGPLHHFNSSITSLSFYCPPNLSFPRNLLSAAADGTISIFDTEPFVLLKSFRSHKKGINDLAVHPSGKLALSVSRDGCLAMSNLIRGKRSFCWKIGVHLAEDARLLLELDNEKRVLCAAPGESGILYTGGESRVITAWDTNSGKVAYSIEDAHSTRVKGIVVLTKDGGSEDDPYLVASASSDGLIRVWDVRMAIKGKPNPLAEANTKSRLTCLAGSYLKSFKRPKIGKSTPKEEDAAE
ncbi:hypothetical protein V6N13_015663 [Hibiscus sabdariffa]|uniref:P21-activated protein kinase-interacting protein 1-like n=1 Tax=Hibiscus sabdariffa TaxID=183260 RepID=A0ABR2CWC5_9ROSI